MPSQVELNDLEADDRDDKPKAKSSRSKSRPSSSTAQEKDLRGRLSGCFDRIAATLDERGDEELAELVRQDAEVMSQGLVSLTRPFRALRTPLLAVIAVIEPALAFGRIARLLGGRWAERRAEQAAAAQAQAVE